MPTASENQDARDWLHAHVKPDNTALAQALANAQADGYSAAALALAATGEVAKPLAVTGAATAKSAKTYWDDWKAGDVGAADLVHDSGFRALMRDQDVAIRGISDTTLDRMGTLLSEGAARGDSVDTIARSMEGILDDPSRAYGIANTELARAVSQATADTFEANDIEEWDWLVSDDACDECLDEEDSNPHSLGDLQPPLHPSCRCAMSPGKMKEHAAEPAAEAAEAEPVEESPAAEAHGAPTEPATREQMDLLSAATTNWALENGFKAEEASVTGGVTATSKGAKLVAGWSKNGSYRAIRQAWEDAGGVAADIDTSTVDGRKAIELEKYLETAPTWNGLSYRGLAVNVATQEVRTAAYWEAKMGQTMTWWSPSSASLKESVALEAAEDRGVILELEGGDGKYIAPMSQYLAEQEVLMPPGSQWEVVSVRYDRDEGVLRVRLRPVKK